MSEDHEPTAIVDTWLNGKWTPEQSGVIAAAETLAHHANLHRPWWRRRKVSPMEMLPAARDVVTGLLVDGWRPSDDGSEGAR